MPFRLWGHHSPVIGPSPPGPTVASYRELTMAWLAMGAGLAEYGPGSLKAVAPLQIEHVAALARGEPTHESGGLGEVSESIIGAYGGS